MANKIFSARVKNKRDTEANWESKNPVLLDGEIIVVTTTSGDTRFKVGDGKKTYKQLPFQDQKTRDLIPSVDASLSSTSTNPVQNKIIKTELDKKAERDVVNTTTNGLMSVADKNKLDGIADGANKTVVDTTLSTTSTNPVQNKAVKAAIDKIAEQTLIINVVGDMSGVTADMTPAELYAYVNENPTHRVYAKLDFQNEPFLLLYQGVKNDIITFSSVISESDMFDSAPLEYSTVVLQAKKTATKWRVPVASLIITGNLVDSALSSTSTNPVQNKTINSALSGKAGTSVATTSANGLMSSSDKSKLDGIASGANKTTVDSSLSGSSTNPVQNKVVKAALDGKLSTAGGTLTGNLTGQYITGTWLQTTAAADLSKTSSKVAVLDDSGWVYYRTPAEIRADIGITDYVESQGTTGSWTWRKWHSGLAEMWATFEATSLAVNTAWGSVYYGTWMNSTVNKNGRKYPFAFTSTPVVTATPYSPSTDFWLLTDSGNNLGTPQTYAPAYACVLPGSTTISNPKIHYYVTGRFK